MYSRTPSILWIEIERNALLDLIKRVNLFVINDTEAEELTEENNIILSGAKTEEDGPGIGHH